MHDNQYVKSEILDGAEYVNAIFKKVNAEEKAFLKQASAYFSNEKEYDPAVEVATSLELTTIFQKYTTKTLVNKSAELQVYVE